MGETAADRAAIAHRAIGDAGRHRAHRAAGDVRHAAVLDIGVGDAAAERSSASGVCSTRLSSAMAVMSTKQVGLHQPQIEHRTERLAAGDDLRPSRRRRRTSAIAAARSAGRA